MSKECACITIDDVYGKGWFAANEKTLNEKYDWEFRIPKNGERVMCRGGNDLLSHPIQLSDDYGSKYNWPDAQPAVVAVPKPAPKPLTVKDIYGVDNPVIPEGWVNTGEFRVLVNGDKYLSAGLRVYTSCCPKETGGSPRIILRRIGLTDIYGQDKVEIPAEYEWTGEFRKPGKGDIFWSPFNYLLDWTIEHSLCSLSGDIKYPYRLILRKKTPKVYFKAEEKARLPKNDDWYVYSKNWIQATGPDHQYSIPELCGTRHEDIDNTVQVVTQSDIDKIWEDQ